MHSLESEFGAVSEGKREGVGGNYVEGSIFVTDLLTDPTNASGCDFNSCCKNWTCVDKSDTKFGSCGQGSRLAAPMATPS